MTVRIVTDSTSDLPADVVEKYGITVVPLSVRFGDEEFLDGVDLDHASFYKRLVATHLTPATGQPSVDAFRNVYQELLPGSDGIVSIHISSKLSGTLNSASVAREELGPEAHIDLVDSYSASCALGEVVWRAADVASRGGSRDQVLAAARETIGRVSIFVVLDTIEYLRRGGRIGRAQALLGSMLSIKPIVQIENGEVAPFERVRTRRKSFERLFALASEDRTLERLYIGGSAGSEDEIEELVDRLAPLMPHTDFVRTTIGPTVGVHVGPGAIGLCRVRRR